MEAFELSLHGYALVITNEIRFCILSTKDYLLKLTDAEGLRLLYQVRSVAHILILKWSTQRLRSPTIFSVKVGDITSYMSRNLIEARC